MFESIRKNTRVMALLLGVVVVPAFVLVGVSGYSRYSERSEAVAQVGSSTITREEWDRAHQAEIQRMQRTSPGVDLKWLDGPQARYATLERLVQQRILTTARDEQLLTVSDTQLAQALLQDPLIASLRDQDGRLDSARYRDLLASQGYTPQSYEANLRADLATAQVTDVVSETGVMPSAVSQPVLDAFFQRRTVALRQFAAQDFESGISLKDEEVRAYYDQHPQDFQAPETVDVSYVVLDQDALAKDISVDEADLRAYYEQNKTSLSTPERRRVRHILITPADDAGRAKAQALLEQLKAAPQTFAEVAKTASADPGSAAEGGDLGWVDRGAMVKPFEDAAFALAPNVLSDLVKTEFGWHIMEVTQVQAATVKPYEQVRDQLLADVRKGKARTLFAESVEPFSNLVYEQAHSFEAVANKFKLQVQQQQGLTRQGAAGVLSNRKLLDAIFSAESMSNRANIDAMEVDRTQMVSARVTAHTPAHTRSFEEVQVQARAALLAQRSAQAARAAGEQALKQARETGQLAQLAAPIQVARDQPGALAPAVLREVLRADVSQLPTWVGMDLGAEGYAIARLDAVSQREAPKPEVSKQELTQLQRSYGSAESQAYMSYLRAHYKTKILVPNPAAAVKS